MDFQFRDYQADAVKSAMEYINSSRKDPVVMVEPTAAGKSWIIAGIAKEYEGPIVLLQPSLELLAQNFEKFEVMGGEASIYSAGAGSKDLGHVTYATLESIKKLGEQFREAGVKLVIIDECHTKVKPNKGSMFRTFMDALKPEKVVGLTATPFRLKNYMYGSKLMMLNRTMPRYFKDFIHVTQIQEMIDRGYWCPSLDESWIQDESGLKLNSTGSEYTEESIKKYVEENKVNNKIYLRVLDAIQQGRKSILVFVDSVASCERFCEFLEQEDGVTCAYLTSKTKKKDRKEIVAGFKSGEIQVLFNYQILSTGFDHPGLDAILMGRPTNSLAIFYQIYGRGVRILEGKKDFLFADYGNNFRRLAHPRLITIENIPGYGWCVMCGDRLVTDVHLGDNAIVTRQDVIDKANKKKRKTEAEKHGGLMPFGAHKGKLLADIAKEKPSYFDWILSQDWLKPELEKKIRAVYKQASIDSLGSEDVKGKGEMNFNGFLKKEQPTGPVDPF